MNVLYTEQFNTEYAVTVETDIGQYGVLVSLICFMNHSKPDYTKINLAFASVFSSLNNAW